MSNHRIRNVRGRKTHSKNFRSNLLKCIVKKTKHIWRRSVQFHVHTTKNYTSVKSSWINQYNTHCNISYNEEFWYTFCDHPWSYKFIDLLTTAQLITNGIHIDIMHSSMSQWFYRIVKDLMSMGLLALALEAWPRFRNMGALCSCVARTRA